MHKSLKDRASQICLIGHNSRKLNNIYCINLSFRWLDQLLERIIWVTSVFLLSNHFHEMAVQERFNSVSERLAKLRNEQESVMHELRNHLKVSVENVIGELVSYLKLPDVVDKFSKWNEDELPEDEGSSEVIEAGITKLVQTRLQGVIQEWEDEQQKFAEARRSVISLFLLKYRYLEKELRGLEVRFCYGPALMTKAICGALPTTMVEARALPLTMVEGSALPTTVAVVSLSDVLLNGLLHFLALPYWGVKAVFDWAKDKHWKSKYLKNRPEYVKTVSLKYLERVSTQEALQPIVDDQVKQVMMCLQDIKRRIPMLIEADEQLCQQLMSENQSKKDIEEKYKPKKLKYEELRGKLAMFGALEIRSMQIGWNDLVWDVSEEVGFQSVLLPGIYKGRIAKKGDPSRPVNLKVYKELISISNATECLTSEKVIR